jgi:hypothetical protein
MQRICANCMQPIIGQVLEYRRANSCVPCYERLTGERVRAEEEIAEDSQRRQDAAQVRQELKQWNQAPQPQTKQYKILTQRDGFFSGRFDPDKIEAAINHYASEGWIVVSMATAAFPGGLAGNRDELIVLYERPFYTELPNRSAN